MFSNIFPHPFECGPECFEPEPKAPCGCDEQDCTPATHEGERYCQACGEDLPADYQVPEGLTPITLAP